MCAFLQVLKQNRVKPVRAKRLADEIIHSSVKAACSIFGKSIGGHGQNRDITAIRSFAYLLRGFYTIQFRHFGSLGPDISLYRVPGKYGGRKDILFVTQDYNYLYPEQSVGGVYVIRPRKL